MGCVCSGVSIRADRSVACHRADRLDAIEREKASDGQALGGLNFLSYSNSQEAFDRHRHPSSRNFREGQIFTKEIGPCSRAAEDRFRTGAANSASSDSRALFDWRSHWHLEPGERRGHAALSSRPGMAVKNRPRLARSDQAGPGAKQRPSAQSRECYEQYGRGSESGFANSGVAEPKTRVHYKNTGQQSRFSAELESGPFRAAVVRTV